MKNAVLAIACFVLTLAALSWLAGDNQSVIAGTHDFEPGTVLQNSDVQTFVYSWRIRMPKRTINCWIDCRDRAIGHTVIRPVEKYQPLTISDIN